MEREKNDTMEVASRNRRRRTWVKIVGALACIVVFVTTYALVLPAITLNKEPLCGIEEHTHTQACYGPAEPSTYSVLSCSLDSLDVHQHSPDCCGADGSLLCGYADYIVHVHDASCYDADGTLVCQLPEVYTHTHTSDCYTSAADAPTCQLPQIAVHTHTADCYDSGALVCGMLETRAHRHTDDCFQVMQAESEETVLTCTLEEHVHTEACYTEAASEPVSDPNADVETQEQWEATLYGIRLTGEYRQDILTVAYSQLGYSESSRNFVLDGDGNANGYTRYGAWYGDDCGEWCAMFVSFCLHYAGVPEADMPLAQNCETWIALLRQQERYFEADSAAPDGPVPAAGDLIFFSSDGSGVSDHVGLVTAYIPATETETAKVCTIEGNNANAVRAAEYEALDARILGYAQLPEQSFYCGETGHTHSAACGMRACTLDEHIHTDACLDPAQEEFDFVLTAQTESGVTVTVSGAADALPYPADEITLTVAELQNEQADQLCRQALAEEGLSAEKNYLFDVCLWHGEEQIEPTGPLTLTFSGFADEAVDFKVYHIDEQADEATDMHAALDENGSVQLDTDHFSTYSVTPLALSGSGVSDFSGLWHALQSGTNCYLTKDIKSPQSIEVKSTVTLDLNGHTITWTGGTDNIPFNVTGGTFTLKSSATATDTIKSTTNINSWISEDIRNKYAEKIFTALAEISGREASYDTSEKVLTYYVTTSTAYNDAYTQETLVEHTVDLSSYGAIECTTVAAPACLIQVSDGAALKLEGGRLTNTYGETSIYSTGSSTVSIRGGYLCGNNQNTRTEELLGGAVRSDSDGALNISGGVIAANAATRGGGIHKANGAFTMTGGVISGNTLPSSRSWTEHIADEEDYLLGGGVCIIGADSTISGGYITNNNVVNNYYEGRKPMGGGVAQYGGTLRITGGYITGNRNTHGGGGVGFSSKDAADRFTMTGGVIAANVANVEGGGLRFTGQNDTPHLISGGYITNNWETSNWDWGGGGIFVLQGSRLQVMSAYIVDNDAGGYGAGVAGCPTAQIAASGLVDDGAAVFDNTAIGEHRTANNTDANGKPDDYWIAQNGIFTSNGYQDFFSVGACMVSGQMLGGGAANWTGSTGLNTAITVPLDMSLHSFEYATGLTAAPNSTDKANALNAAKMFITGNVSYTHGGGIMSNGVLYLGKPPEEISYSPGLTINLNKLYRNSNNERIKLTGSEFTFLLLNEAPSYDAASKMLTYSESAVVATATNDKDGDIQFNIKYSEDRTYTYYLMEKPEDRDITYDTTVYRLIVTVSMAQQNMTAPAGETFSMVYYFVSQIDASFFHSSTGDMIDVDTYIPDPTSCYSEAATVSLTNTSGGASFVNTTTGESDLMLRLKKVDSKTHEVMSGVTFYLCKPTDYPNHKENAVVRTTNSEGFVSFPIEPLRAIIKRTATYWLYEDVPSGYTPAGPWIVEISYSSSSSVLGGKISLTAKLTPATEDSDGRLIKAADAASKSVTVSSDSTPIFFDFEHENTPIEKLPQLRINKTDSATGLPMKDVAFTLRPADAPDSAVTLTTDYLGNITFDVALPAGGKEISKTYWLYETAPDRYEQGGPWILVVGMRKANSGVVYTATLTEATADADGNLTAASGAEATTVTMKTADDETAYFSFSLKNTPLVHLLIGKLDALTDGEMEGVQFTLRPAYSLDEAISKQTDEGGGVWFDIELPGRDDTAEYWLYEQTPEGYTPAGPWVIVISYRSQDGYVATMQEAIADEDGNLTGVANTGLHLVKLERGSDSFNFHYIIYNTPTAKVQLKKIDSMTGTAMPNVAFKLCLPGKQDSTDWKLTNDDGFVEFDIEVPADVQEYWLLEQTPPDYTPAGPWILTIYNNGDGTFYASMDPYRAKDDGTPDELINTGTIGFTMDQTDNQITFSHTLSNTRTGKLEIKKVDSVTEKALSGAIFNLAPAPVDPDDSVDEWKWTSYQTGENGLASFTIDLPSGDAGDTSRDYWLTETPPANYNQAGPWILRITRHVTNNVVSYSAALYPAYLYGSELREQSNAQSESVAVTEDGDTFKASLTIENTNPTPNKLTLLKLDSLSGDLITGKVTFSLCRENDLGNRETLSGHGSLSFSIPTPSENSTDTYWLFEEQAPPGYTKAGPWIIDVYWNSASGRYIADLYQATEDASGALVRQAEAISFYAVGDGTFDLNLDIENTPEPPYELWIKKVDSVTGAPMPDVLFMLTRLGQGQSIQQRTDQDGWAKFSISYDPENDGDGPHYLLEELTPPGYHTDGPWEFSCGLSMDEDGNERLELNLAGGDTLIKDETLSDSSKSVFVFEIKNTPNDETIRIHKTDSATGASMPGVTFRLCLPDDPTNYLTVTTDETGDASFPLAKLPEPNEPVTYWLFEEQQPGYLPAGPWVLEIIREDNQYHMIWYLAATDENGYPTNDPIEPETTIYPTDDPLYFAINIQNSPMPELPEAGGFPSVLYMLGGAAVLAGALAYMIRRRRRGRA